MGDMKTPDFDDLLAAFDIPDMVDPRAALESGHAHHDEDAGVSVIVKNVRNRVGGPEGARNRLGPISGEVDDASDGRRGLPRLRRNPPAGPGSGEEVLRLQTPGLRETGTDSRWGPQETETIGTRGPPKPRKPEVRPKGVAKGPGGKTALVAVAALSASKANPGPPTARPLTTKQGSPREAKESPKEPQRLPEPEPTKKGVSKQPGSPRDAGEGSPSPSPGSVPAVPRVRIKTIKTSSGQIKRTVTRVLPEMEREGLGEGLSPPAPLDPAVPPPERAPLPAGVTRQVTIKPVATAFLPVSAVRTAVSQVISLKLSNNTTLKATVVPAASVLKAADAVQRRATAGLTGLNLVPQAAPGSGLRRVPGPATERVPRVQVPAGWQSSVVEAFNRVLSGVNPVPAYVPDLRPPSSACISLPPRGYKCLECGDSFALERSLAQHHGRRSVRIEVACSHCARSLVFFNKCSLLSHARGHKDKGAVMQCSHLVLKPIPADQMIPSVAHVAPLGPGGPPRVREKGEAAVPPGAGVECSECHETFQEESSLAAHYQQASDSTGQITCPTCQMLLPSPCSLASHRRLHQRRSPYICPECGAACLAANFLSHVTTACLHYARRVGYRCVHCGVIFSDASTLKCHVQASHCEIFYKCPVCPMAFKSAPGTHSHASTQHPGLEIGEPKLIYKCSMCDTVFTQQILLHTHFDQHVSSHRVSVFKCPDCSAHYAQKQLMLDHVKSKHGTPPHQGVGLPLGTKPVDPPDPGHAHDPRGARRRPPLLQKTPPPGWTCEDCGRLFTQRESFVSHMKREHGKHLKKHPCRLCEKSFSSSHSLCRHNRVKHKGVRKVYTCPNCPDSKRPFTKRVLLEKHMDLVHGVSDPERKAAPESNSADEPCIKEQVRGVKRKLNSEGEDAEEEEEEEEEEEGPGRGARVAPRSATKLQVSMPKTQRCAVCGFTCAEAGPFAEHLPQHRSDGSTHQCARCGLCYTSRHSLARHLFIVHRLRESPAGGAQGHAPPDTPGNHCRVCGKVFDAESALNAHMRTHGMAFIESKRLSAAEK